MRNIKTRNGFEFWDKLNALPRYAFLLSPSGKSVQKFEDQAMGKWIDVHEAQKVVDQAQDEINQFRAERDALQQRLNAADQRIDEQVQERETLISYGRSLGLDEASTLCSRMAYDEYYPKASRFRFFVPKAQEKLGNLLIKAAYAIANLPGGPYERHCARQQKKAEKSATAR
ncbi:hypothetical protein [Pseudomonas sp. R45(2017)]|uniref:hypothetical protein n=1 Tax=Pseudomonas sp. R45(2017) TaxID=1981678 RepID=UPI00111C34D4|nr:hypothetical protein [Pseudomonas sp. R45(2017)]